MISLILLEKILSLFCSLLIGFFLSKRKIVDSDCRTLSIICMYVSAPCIILSSIWFESSDATASSLTVSMIAAVIMSITAILIAELLKKPLRFTPIETISVAFANVGNLTVPIVASMLGSEYIIYTLPYIICMNVFFWSLNSLILHIPNKNAAKSILTNPNIIAIFLSAVLYVLKVPRIPIISEAVISLGNLLGPMAMLIVGISLGAEEKFKKEELLRVSAVSFVRLIVVPIISVFLLKILGLKSYAENGEIVLMITMMGAAGPSASMIVQLAQVKMSEKDAAEASMINLISTLCCVITMPLIIFIYQLVMM